LHPYFFGETDTHILLLENRGFPCKFANTDETDLGNVALKLLEEGGKSIETCGSFKKSKRI